MSVTLNVTEDPFFQQVYDQARLDEVLRSIREYLSVQDIELSVYEEEALDEADLNELIGFRSRLYHGEDVKDVLKMGHGIDDSLGGD
jgi:hypothetical protein